MERSTCDDGKTVPARHTPGPWDFGPGYSPGSSTFDLFGRGGRQVIASASYENMWLAAYDKSTDHANARLIAAAPELLEALTALLATVTVRDSEGGRRSYILTAGHPIARALAERAIAKALETDGAGR